MGVAEDTIKIIESMGLSHILAAESTKKTPRTPRTQKEIAENERRKAVNKAKKKARKLIERR